MKKISRRSFVKAAGSAAVLSMLAACGGSSSSTAASTVSTAASTAGASSAAAASFGPDTQAIVDRGVLKVGVKNAVQGFSFQDTLTGEYKGLEDSLAEMIAEYLGVDVEFTTVTAATRGELLDSGDIDAVLATFTITEERKKSWDFSTPYRTDYVGLMVKKRSGFTSIEDLDGKVIGVSQGATTQGLIEQMIKDNGFSCKPEFRAFSGYPIIKSSLDAGNIDVFAMDRSTLAGYMNETVELLQPEVKFGEQGYGVATKKGCDLSAVVDQVICDRLADGWLDQEVKTWGLV